VLPNSNVYLSSKQYDAQLRAALGLPVGEIDASIYMQQQRELQREFQLRQLIFHEQFAENRLKQLRDRLDDYPDIQQQYSQLLQERLQHGQDPASFARAQLQHHLAQTQAQAQAQAQLETVAAQQQQAAGLVLSQADSSVKDVHGVAPQPSIKNNATNSHVVTSVKKTQAEKKTTGVADHTSSGTASAPRKRPRAGTDDTLDSKKKKKEKPPRATTQDVTAAIAELGKAAADATNSDSKPPALDLLDFASSTVAQPEKIISRGSIGDLLSAAESEERTDAAAVVLQGIKALQDVFWEETSTVDTVSEIERAREKGEVIELPNFTSFLPQLPEEQELLVPPSSEKKKKKKHKSLLDSDSLDESSKSRGGTEVEASNKSVAETSAMLPPKSDYQSPIDAWWPSLAEIRKERKILGEPQDDDIFQEEDVILEPDMPFRANFTRIKDRLVNDVAPGVFEMVCHCRVHELHMNPKKGSSTSYEPVHCFQVTELYPKELMVCCSVCGTWRHAACGGHYKPYSVRECVDVPFTAICDRCHAEEKVLCDYPTAKRRLDRQRNELLRRALSTSATIRQLSFSKHGGSYKWPLGSVSTTHIGGHTRSVHLRQEKAEKQWKEMVYKLSKDYGSKTKERVRMRTRELEKLLSSVEDAGTYGV